MNLKMNGKIGIGYITCDAPYRVSKTLPLLPRVDELVIVNDGEEKYLPQQIPHGGFVIQHTKNKGVGISKNEALEYLMTNNCEHLFLIEDDVIIKNQEVLNEYIRTSRESGILHLNYALQGPLNVKKDLSPNTKAVVNYKNTSVAVYHHICGALSYYHRSVIEKVGYIDEQYTNALEHVDHTYKIIKAGMHPPFWWFADIEKSYHYLDNVEGCIEKSMIRNNPEFANNFNKGVSLFEKNNGISILNLKDEGADDFKESIGRIKKEYGKEIV